jgi:PadR family transcriptional regulator
MSKAVTERFVKSFLDLFVLDLLDDSPKHGYEIMRELKNRTGTRIGAGTLYPLLYELEERKLVAGEWNSPNRRSRKIYKITDQGAKFKRQGFGSISLYVRPSGSTHTGA